MQVLIIIFVLMKQLLLLILIVFLGSSGIAKRNHSEVNEMKYCESEILEQLDLAFNELPSKYYPSARPQDVKYAFFLDLEHGYFATAGSRIHLYADTVRWAIVFEKNGYFNRGTSAEIELVYIGNCIDYPVQKDEERNYITNTESIVLIDPLEFERLQNKEGQGMENFELIGQNVKEIKIRDKYIPFDNDFKNYEKLGIRLRDYENPKKLIGFGDLIRYLHETNPDLIRATNDEIRLHIPKDIPKIMTIEAFHYVSLYDKINLPSQQETYKLIAKVLTTKDTLNWKPLKQPNNNWKNWTSGNL